MESIVDLLQTHLNADININSASVLKLNCEVNFIEYTVSKITKLNFLNIYTDEGNVYLRDGEVDRAIVCYSEALNLGEKSQEAVLLAMRGTAYLQRAYEYK